MSLKRIKKNMVIISILYCLLMIYLLFLQRYGINNKGSYLEYLNNFTNLKPFETIVNFVKILKSNHSYTRELVQFAFINIGGNLVMFIPLGVFIPIYLRKASTYCSFIIIVSILIFLIEFIQVITMLGSFDVDDIILNVIGASIGYIFYKKTVLRKVKLFN
jgi:Glycopeptide antibiotics resistance protein